MFLFQNLFLEDRSTLAPLSPLFLPLLDKFQMFRFLLLIDFLQDDPAGFMAIEPLGTLLLALDLDAGRYMAQDNARRCFVDVLPAGSGGPHEHFPEILLKNAQSMHPAL